MHPGLTESLDRVRPTPAVAGRWYHRRGKAATGRPGCGTARGTAPSCWQVTSIAAWGSRSWQPGGSRAELHSKQQAAVLTGRTAPRGSVGVSVPSRGTAAICPRCGGRLRHHTSPEPLHRGYRWAHCSHRQLPADRDQAAAHRICSRGLSSQPTVHQDGRTGHLEIHRAQDAQAAHCSPPAQAVLDSKATHPAGALVMPGPLPARGSRGQRPASGGGSLKGGVASAAGQGTGAHSCSTSPGHRPRGVSLGRGFHCNVRATAVVPRGDLGPRAFGHASLSLAGSCKDALGQDEGQTTAGSSYFPARDSSATIELGSARRRDQ